jgi:hypothetical protein
MELKDLLQYLALAELHVGDGWRQIAHQREIIRQIENEGGDTASSLGVLDYLLKVQAEQCADRDDLLREIIRLSTLKPQVSEPAPASGCRGDQGQPNTR